MAAANYNSASRGSPPIGSDACGVEARKVFGGSVGSRGYFDLIATALQSDAYYVRKPPVVIARDIELSGPDLMRGASTLASRTLLLRQNAKGRGDTARYVLSRERNDGVYCFKVPAQPDGSPRRLPWMAIDIANLTDPVDVTSGEDSAAICSGERAPRTASPASPTVYIYIRSVEGIFQYLGRMLMVSPADRALPFFIDRQRPIRPRFKIDYRGNAYYVAESSDPCGSRDVSTLPAGACRSGADGSGRRDETLFILSVLNQLLDLYKNGSDIPVTPAVQAVP